MRRILATSLSRQACLRRARQFETEAQFSRSQDGAAWALDQARLYRSLALVAKPDDDAVSIDPDVAASKI